MISPSSFPALPGDPSKSRKTKPLRKLVIHNSHQNPGSEPPRTRVISIPIVVGVRRQAEIVTAHQRIENPKNRKTVAHSEHWRACRRQVRT